MIESGEVKCLDRETVNAMLHEIQVYEDHKIKLTYNFSEEDL